MLEEQFNQITLILKNAKKVLVASHQNPDSDAVASVLALYRAFKNRGLETMAFLPDEAPGNLGFLPGFFEIKTNIGSFEPDTIVCLDYGDFRRLKLPENISALRNCHIITIDHHLESDQRGEVLVLEPSFSSTSEIIYHWYKHENLEIDKDVATLLLTGIFSDSGGFCHASTTPGTMNIVSELLLKGAPFNKIVRQTIHYQKPLNLCRVWGQVLARTKIDEVTGLAYSSLNSEDLTKSGVKMADFDGITNIISAASRINLGMFLVEYEKGMIKGSLRSEPSAGKNVAQIVKSLGGGGHQYAAGFTQAGSVDEVLKKVLNLIK